MEKHYQARSKGKWGREEAKTAAELNKLCTEFFEKLEVPPEWNCMGWANVRDEEQGLLSVGKKYRDMRTRGIDMMEYRVYFLTFSQRGGIVDKQIIDFGKFKKHCVVNNKTVENLNAFIRENYFELEK